MAPGQYDRMTNSTCYQQSRPERKALNRLLVLELDPGQLRTLHRSNEPQQLVGSGGDGQARGTDVRNTVALGIDAAAARLPCQINTQAIGGCEAWPLANQYCDRFGAHGLADAVAKGDTPMFRHNDRRNGVTSLLENWDDACQQRRRLALDSEGGKTIADDEQHGVWCPRQLRAIRLEQLTAQIRSQQIATPIAHSAAYGDAGQACRNQVRLQCLNIQRGMDRVARRGMRRL